MQVPYIKAKDKDTGVEWEGFYFEYPSTTYCLGDENKNVPLVHCLVSYRTTDWGLPNRPILVSNIDTDSIEVIKYVDINTEKCEKTSPKV